jgi:hypothetical protein
MKKGLTVELGRKMAVLDERTVVFYDPRIETERGEPLHAAPDEDCTKKSKEGSR